MIRLVDIKHKIKEEARKQTEGYVYDDTFNSVLHLGETFKYKSFEVKLNERVNVTISAGITEIKYYTLIELWEVVSFVDAILDKRIQKNLYFNNFNILQNPIKISIQGSMIYINTKFNSISEGETYTSNIFMMDLEAFMKIYDEESAEFINMDLRLYHILKVYQDDSEMLYRELKNYLTEITELAPFINKDLYFRALNSSELYQIGAKKNNGFDLVKKYLLGEPNISEITKETLLTLYTQLEVFKEAKVNDIYCRAF